MGESAELHRYRFIFRKLAFIPARNHTRTRRSTADEGYCNVAHRITSALLHPTRSALRTTDSPYSTHHIPTQPAQNLLQSTTNPLAHRRHFYPPHQRHHTDWYHFHFSSRCAHYCRYLSRLARGPDVIWDRKNNPTPWNNVEPGTNTKLMSVNQQFDKSYKRDRL